MAVLAVEHPDKALDRALAELGDAHPHRRQSEVTGERNIVEAGDRNILRERRCRRRAALRNAPIAILSFAAKTASKLLAGARAMCGTAPLHQMSS